MTKLNEDEYQCVMCRGIFGYVKDENWNNDKAVEEAKELFGIDATKDKVDIVCDECFKKGQDFGIIPRPNSIDK